MLTDRNHNNINICSRTTAFDLSCHLDDMHLGHNQAKISKLVFTLQKLPIFDQLPWALKAKPFDFSTKLFYISFLPITPWISRSHNLVVFWQVGVKSNFVIKLEGLRWGPKHASNLMKRTFLEMAWPNKLIWTIGGWISVGQNFDLPYAIRYNFDEWHT